MQLVDFNERKPGFVLRRVATKSVLLVFYHVVFITPVIWTE
jgi:hypothetical protein